jgi:hypothetical protein
VIVCAHHACNVNAHRLGLYGVDARTDRKQDRKALQDIADFHDALSSPEPTKPHSPRNKNERSPRRDIGKRILDQIDAGLSATAAIKSAMEEFNIARRTAYKALSDARAATV